MQLIYYYAIYPILHKKNLTKYPNLLVFREEKLPPEVRYWPTSPHLRLCTVLGAICQEQGWAGGSISTVGTIMAPGAGKRSGVRSVWVLEFAHDQLLEVCESALLRRSLILAFCSCRSNFSSICWSNFSVVDTCGVEEGISSTGSVGWLVVAAESLRYFPLGTYWSSRGSMALVSPAL